MGGWMNGWMDIVDIVSIQSIHSYLDLLVLVQNTHNFQIRRLLLFAIGVTMNL